MGSGGRVGNGTAHENCTSQEVKAETLPVQALEIVFMLQEFEAPSISKKWLH
jgi:hypothetical protein